MALIYGLNYSIAKDVMPDYMQPRGFILVRVLGATLLFHLISFIWRGEKIARQDWPRMAAAAFFGVAANQLLFFEGLNLTSPIHASVIMTTNPLIVVGLSAIFLKVPIRPVRMLGIALGLAGAVFLITRGHDWSSILNRGQSLGNLLVFLNAACFAAYLIIAKPLMAKYRALSVIRWVFTIGTFYVLPFGFRQMQQTDWLAMPPLIIGEIGFVVVGTTFLAYLLNMYSLKTVSSTTVSFYIYLQPVFATLAAVALGKDQLGWGAALSALLIFSGIYLVSFYRK